MSQVLVAFIVSLVWTHIGAKQQCVTSSTQISPVHSESEMSARSVSPGPQPPEEQHVKVSVVVPDDVEPNPQNSQLSEPSLQGENVLTKMTRP